MSVASSVARVCRGLIRRIAILVPRLEREDWVREWNAELVHRERRVTNSGHAGAGLDLLRRTLGAVIDAYVLRRMEWNGDMIGQDLRYAARTIVRAPVFSSVIVLTLALGIGANTAVFSIVNGILFQPLDLPDSDGLVMVWESNLERGWSRFSVSPANYVDWRDRVPAFESMAAMAGASPTLTGQGDPVRLRATAIDAAFFDVVRVQPVLGRPFTPADATPGSDPVVIVSHALWQRGFGGDSNVVGTSIRLDGRSTNVVGVMPRHFGFPQIVQSEPMELWVPLIFDFDVAGARGAHYLNVVARLSPGVGLIESQQAMNVLSASLAQTYPATNTGWSATVVPLLDQILGNTIRQTLFVIWGAVALVLAITCVNIASLLLSRSTARQPELAVRAALGARRSRLVRQLLAESLMLTGIGALTGVGLAVVGIHQLAALDPGDIPRLHDVRIDATALLYTIGVAVIVGLGSGLVPVFHATKRNALSTLTAARGHTGSRGQERVRQVLVISEIAMALVVVVGSTLLARSLRELQSVDLGFRHDQVLTATLSLPRSRYDTPERVNAFYQRVLAQIRQTPGVIAAGAGSPTPLGGDFRFSYRIVGDDTVDPTVSSALFRRVAGDYFDVLAIPVVQGRTFDERDSHGANSVIVINQAFAERHFGATNPIGRSMSLGTSDMPCPCEIIGVVANVRQYGPGADPQVGVYVAQAQLNGFRSLTLVVRTVGAPAGLAPAVRRAIHDADPNLAVSQLDPYRDRVAQSFARPRFNTLVLSSFAIIALALAVVGIFGLMTYTVSRRTREIGIRIALGSAPRQVYRLLVARTLGLTAIGTVIGLAAAAASTRLLAGMLFEVGPIDPLTFTGVPILLIGVGVLAGLVPAHRAAAVDPVVTLREE